MLPGSVKIGAHTFKVKLATVKELGPDAAGDVDDTRNIIRVARHAPRSRKIEVLIHECLHAMIAGHDFKDEETIIVILGEALTQFLADNPDFITEALRVLSDTKKS